MIQAEFWTDEEGHSYARIYNDVPNGYGLTAKASSLSGCLQALAEDLRSPLQTKLEKLTRVSQAIQVDEFVKLLDRVKNLEQFQREYETAQEYKRHRAE